MKPDASKEDLPLAEAERIAYLIAGFLRKTITEEEHDELDAWVIASEENMRLFEELTDENNIEAALLWQKKLDGQKALHKIKQKVGLRKHSRPFLHSFWLYAVTACLILFVIGWVWWKRGDGNGSKLAHISKEEGVHPGTDKAVLTLASGRTIILDSIGTGLLAREGNINIENKGGGALVYLGQDTTMNYNTVSIPRGGQYMITLGDGTKVWLNAETSLRFPAGFSARHREVELSGEAYFEVAKDPARPFTVNIHTSSGDGGKVEVLGTHFNIDSYGDESYVKTTLLEGSVRVQKGGTIKLISPGEQAQMGKDIKVVSVDTKKEVAWKEGLFVFHEAPMSIIAPQLSRWYDVDIEQKGAIPYHFTATIERKESIQEVLQILEATHRVHFNLQGKKLMIQP